MQHAIIALTLAAGLQTQAADLPPDLPGPPDLTTTIEVDGQRIPKLLFARNTQCTGGSSAEITTRTLGGIRDRHDWKVQSHATEEEEGLRFHYSRRREYGGGLQIPAERADLVSLVFHVNGEDRSVPALMARAEETRDVVTWELDAVQLLLLSQAEWIFVKRETYDTQRARSFRLDLDADERGAVRWFTYHHAPGGRVAYRLMRVFESDDPVQAFVELTKRGLELLVTTWNEKARAGAQGDQR